MPSLRLPAFAKINLCLHILGKRPDGYHELRTIFQAISLHDKLELSLVRRSGIELECDHPALPTGRDNLVWRALEVLRRELRLRTGIRARLEKRIPIGRGLGGGSSDAAAALLGLLRLAGRGLAAGRLMEIASGLGADVPFFLVGGRALGVSRGDEVYPLPDAPRRTVVVVSPHDLAVSTRDAYRWASARLTKRTAAPKLFEFCALCWSAPGSGGGNDFEAPVFQRYPRLRKIRRELLERGAAEAALAGSGSAVFGIFQNPAQARRAAQGFPESRVFVVETLTRQQYRQAMSR